MAYNREWDRGKDAWSDSNSQPWNGAGAGVRPREEEYFGDNKRRKFNAGGYQGYDTNAAQDDHGNYQNAAGGAFTKKQRMQPSEPSPHVIFLGLDTDFTEADLQAYLSSNGCSVETVTIIRERSTGASKGFGFAQFASTEHARAFVDPLFPFIQVPPPASHGGTATVAFYKALEAGQPTNGRRVKIDFSQSATPHERRANRANVNDGTRDIGNSQSAILLFRGLDALSGPQAIHQAMRNSSGVGKEGAKGMKRIILIKDRATMASFGFAFVEFVDIQSAAAVLAATMSPQIHPSGFRISDVPVAASFGHSESFQPIDNVMLRDDACIPSSLVLGGMEGHWVRYWDETSTLAMLEFQVASTAAAVNTKERKEKKKVKDIAKPLAPAVPSAITVSSKPMTLNFNKGPIKINPAAGGGLKTSVLGFSADDDEPEDDDASRKAGPSKPSHIVSKKTATNITKWNQVQEELSQVSAAPSQVSAPAKVAKNDVLVTPTPSATVKDITATADADFEFADQNTKSCLLCSRQFKSVDQLKRHNKESDLHKTNLKDSALRETARQKVQKAQAPKYRDRASERRVLFNQPDAPMPETAQTSKPMAKREASGPPRPPTPPPAPLNPGQDTNNVGNKLLKMMGWTEGTGLGTSGEGRVDPIKTEIYAEGVGLGASKGKEVGKYAEGYSGYVSMAQDAARERYGS